jgi:hypothetical protein
MATVERRYDAEENVFRKHSSASSSALRASYHIIHLLAKEVVATHSTRGLSSK